MKRVRTVSVNGKYGTRIEITVKLEQKADHDIEIIEDKFEDLVDNVHMILSKTYHVFGIKVSK